MKKFMPKVVVSSPKQGCKSHNGLGATGAQSRIGWGRCGFKKKFFYNRRQHLTLRYVIKFNFYVFIYY